MAEIEQVGTVTEEDLRRAAMAKANLRFNRPSDLQPYEFTVGDWIAFVAEQGRTLNGSSAQRELDSLVSDGVLGKTAKDEKRYDRRSQRAVVAYWYLEDAGGAGHGREDGGPERGPP